MKLHHSNRMEALAGALAGLMRADPGDPFTPERIVVPHPTIGRWLSLELARALGIAANVRFELPAEFAWSIMREALPDLPRESAYVPARLRWRIHDVLPELAQGPEAPAVRGYLGDGDPRKRFELADRLARVFDRCLLYRPDWIREWEHDAAPHWQARLWQRLVGEGRGAATNRPGGEGRGASAAHWVAAVDAFHERIGSGARPPGWPRRAAFFAVSSFSPSYLDMLRRAGEGIEIHLFMLVPCREYWGDVRSRREIGRRVESVDPGEGYFTEGNELLAAWGRAGRDTFDALVESEAEGEEDRFVPPDGACRLAAVQRDVLDLRLASEAAEAEGRQGRQAPPPDDSIQIHVCHSPVREAEVLHDRLLALFDAHDDLEPADVLVLTPNLDVYGPAIEAVFGAAGHIPCNVARTRGGESRTLRAFLDLLALPRSRHGAEPMLAPLAAPAVRARFGIGESDLPAVRARVREAGIRWGVDEAHRGEEGLPETAGHTWRQGLRRLLLGYAMGGTMDRAMGGATDGTAALVAGVVPCSADASGFGGAVFVAGEMNGELLGRFVSYCEGIFGLRGWLAGRRRPAQWGKVLRTVVGDFFSDGSGPARGAGGGVGVSGAGGGGIGGGGRIGGAGGGSHAGELADEVGAVRALIRDFEREAQHCESPVSVEVVLDVLRERAGETGRDPARLADGVAVASLGPGRIVPAGIVCVAGMNHGVFPRLDPAPSFDLVAARPSRRGDRDLRHEDRFAFLEALLAARRCFLVTYTGRDPRDDASIPPSVLVDEMKDYLRRRFPGAAVETRHPLQPFSPRYFMAGVGGSDGLPGGRPSHDGSLQDGSPDSDSPDDGSLHDGSPDGDSPHGEDLFSYSRGMCEAAKAMRGGGKEAGGEHAGSPGRFAVTLPEPEESRRRVALADMVAFFANPARFFLRDRIGARLEVGDAALDEEEPFEIKGLEHYRLRSEMWDQVRAGAAPDRTVSLLQGSGRLPHAGLGLVVHEQAREEAEELRRQLAPYRAALEASPREIDFELGGFRVVGTIEHVGPEGGEGREAGAGTAGVGAAEVGTAEPVAAGSDRMVWWRIGRLRARDRIEIGLKQLAWAAAGHEPVEAVAIHSDRGSWKSTSFPPPDRAREQLEHWLRAWWRGLTVPLPFFPETSLAYAKAVVRAGDDGAGGLEAARAKACDAWFGSRYQRGERHDAYLGLVHDVPDPLAGEFEALAESLLVPLIAAAER